MLAPRQASAPTPAARGLAVSGTSAIAPSARGCVPEGLTDVPGGEHLFRNVP
jgi:hypothetical protein